MRGLLVLAMGLAILGGGFPALAQPPSPDDVLDQVDVTQNLNALVPFDLGFRDKTGASARLGDYFGAKPVILTLNYYACPNRCSLVLTGLVKTLRELTLDVGNEFAIVTVSKAPRDPSTHATLKKTTYLERYGRPGVSESWHFLTGDQAVITQLAQALGFRYASDARRNQYVHAAAIVILAPQAKIPRYFGIEARKILSVSGGGRQDVVAIH